MKSSTHDFHIFVPVDNFNTNNKNDSPNKLIIVKKSRQTDQNDKSCKNHLSFWSVYLDFLTMISLFGRSFLLFSYEDEDIGRFSNLH